MDETADEAFFGFDAIVMPTCAIVAPPVADFARDEDYVRLNMALLRNTAVINFLDRCGISLPCHEPGTAPVGFMLMGDHGGDVELFSVAAAVEAVLDQARGAQDGG
jgi:aspartyl-tRNA(Asn)/glutamyl-tRNA(Gln) amidotransferase subunit A